LQTSLTTITSYVSKLEPGVDLSSPDSLETLAFRKRHVQWYLSKLITDEHRRRYRTDILDDRPQLHPQYFSSSADDAHSLVSATLSHPDLLLSNDDFRIALSVWLDTPPFPYPQGPDAPTCCSTDSTDFIVSFQHTPRCRKFDRTTRHDQIVQMVSRWLTELSIAHLVEERVHSETHDNDRRRPDITIPHWPGKGKIYLDVTCVVAAPPISGARQDLRLKAADDAERAKFLKYHDILNPSPNHKYPLYTLCYESGGAKGKQFRAFLRLVKAYMLDRVHNPLDAQHINDEHRQWRQRIDFVYWKFTAQAYRRAWSGNNEFSRTPASRRRL
jgi:hypothetical protein